MSSIATKSFPAADRYTRYSEWLYRHAVLASLIILVCALSVRLFFTYRADPTQLVFPDSGTYFDTALNLHESGSFLNRYYTPEITRTPGYPVFLAGLMTVVGRDLGILMIVQTVILSLNILVLYWLARQLLPPLMAFVGTLLAAFSPWGAVRAGFLLTDGLFLLVLTLLFLATYFVVQYAQTAVMVIAGGSLVGILTSAVVFVRPVLPLIPLVAVVMFVLYPDKRLRAWLLVGAMLVCAAAPVHLWKMRNVHEAQFNGFTDVSGKAAWQWFSSSVKAQISGADGDRWAMLRAAEEDETHWALSPQEADEERWRRVKALLREHPFAAAYAFGVNAAEPLVHAQASILAPARLNFSGDAFVLGGIWAAFVLCAAFGMLQAWGASQGDESINRNWLLALLGICCVLTLTAGISFGAGSRYRAPLELIIPLLAGVGLVRLVRLSSSQGRILLKKDPDRLDRSQPISSAQEIHK